MAIIETDLRALEFLSKSFGELNQSDRDEDEEEIFKAIKEALKEILKRA